MRKSTCICHLMPISVMSGHVPKILYKYIGEATSMTTK